MVYDDYLPYLLARAAHLVAGRFHQSLREHDLTVLSWRTLAALSGSPGLTVSELAEVALAKQPTVSKLIDRLEGQRLVRRAVDPRDRRRVLVRLTAAGARRIEPVLRDAQSYDTTILAGHPPAEIARLKTLLGELIARYSLTAPVMPET